MSITPCGPTTATDADPTGQSAISAFRSIEPIPSSVSHRAGVRPPGECASIAPVVDIDDGKRIALLDDTGRERDPLLDVALGPALLSAVAAEGGADRLRMYRPRPTLAFSGRDCAAPGIGAAAAAAGLPTFRRCGAGRAVERPPTTPVRCVWIMLGRQRTSTFGPERSAPRFVEFGELLTGALRAVGVDARLGPVPGEYCPGEFSINDGRGHKLVGTAQRLVRGGWLFGTVILVDRPGAVAGRPGPACTTRSSWPGTRNRRCGAEQRPGRHGRRGRLRSAHRLLAPG